jgi:hypothetical protein
MQYQFRHTAFATVSDINIACSIKIQAYTVCHPYNCRGVLLTDMLDE